MSEIDFFRRMTWATLTAAHAHQDPHGIAIHYSDRTWTWAELDRRAASFASFLDDRGIAAGDRIGLLTFNEPEFVEVCLAAARIGAIVVPVNFRLAAREVGFILEDSTPQVVVVSEELAPVLSASGHEVPHVLRLGAQDTGSYEAAVQHGAGLPAVFGDVDENAPALLMYTSGTTGTPKGVVLSHLNLYIQANTNIRAFRLGEDDTSLIATPLFHIAALASLGPVIVLGGTAVIHPVGRFDPSELLDVVEERGVTSLFLVPAQWQAVIDEPSLPARHLGLRSISWGAAPATPTLLRSMTKALPDAINVAVFGQTEMSPVTCVLDGNDAIEKVGSVGRPVPHVQVRVVDSQMNDVPQGEVGEIVYRGATLMKGYWHRPDADAEVEQGGWFHSGDLVYQDEDGFIFVVDRIKDMIISGGENIYCAEVENALGSHPGIGEVAVVGRQDDRWGEVPVAFVVMREGVPVPKIAELRAWLEGRLASYKRPKEIVAVEALPRNPSGKVQKFMLRERLDA